MKFLFLDQLLWWLKMGLFPVSKAAIIKETNSFNMIV